MDARRRFQIVFAVLLLCVAIGIGGFFLARSLHEYNTFSRDFTGFTKDEILNRMGQPVYKSDYTDENGNYFQSLGYFSPYEPGYRVTLELKNDVVIDQSYPSK